MNKEQKKHIVRLINLIVKGQSTSSVVAFIAENNGMLNACRELVENYETRNTGKKNWLNSVSQESGIPTHIIVQEIRDIVALFASPFVPFFDTLLQHTL